MTASVETTETATSSRPVTVAEAEARLGGAEARVRAAQQRAAAADGLAADLQGTRDDAEQDRSAAEAELAAAELHLDQLADMDWVGGQVRAVAERRLADAEARWSWAEQREEEVSVLADDADAALRAAERELDEAEGDRWSATYAVRAAAEQARQTRQTREADHDRAHQQAAAGMAM
ncbi:MAG: hypothetical protein GEV12_23405 [Micromonosporaceae bacterium]|nr:hypothetical protein [Micromonosporaceae bacterium]